MKKFFWGLLWILLFPGICFAGNEIVINEIAWMGTDESANAEWLELYNNTEEEMDLNGWRLESADGSPKINLTGKIKPKNWYLLERTGEQTLPTITADQIYTGSLSNTGENLILYDLAGKVVDEIDASAGWPGGSNDNKNTMERAANGLWQTSLEPGGTPKAPNSSGLNEPGQEPKNDTASSTPETNLPSYQIAPLEIIQELKKGDLIINEIFPNPKENPEEKEFIEIKNVSNKTINLKNFTLKNAAKQNYTIGEIGLAPNAIAVFYRSQTNLVIDNIKEKIVLYSNQNKIIDESSPKETPEMDFSWQKNSDPLSDDKFCWQKPNPGQDNVCQSIIRPIINLNGPDSGEVFKTLFFDASDSFDKLGRKMKFIWEFGDGRIDFGNRVRQIYIAPGTYELKLKIIIDQIASSTEIKKIKIKNNIQPTTTTQQETALDLTEKNIAKKLDYLPNIFISEFLADPNEDEAENEFIEIFSNEVKPYDLSGFKLSDGATKAKPYVFAQGTIIKPGQYLAFFRAQTKIALNNDGDTIKLISPDEQIIDQVIYEKSKTGQSQVLDENFIWQISQTPTPGEINVLSSEKDAKKDATEPKVLGAQSSEENIKSKETKTVSEKSFGRYIFSGVSAAFAVTIGAIYKFFKK